MCSIGIGITYLSNEGWCGPTLGREQYSQYLLENFSMKIQGDNMLTVSRKQLSISHRGHGDDKLLPRNKYQAYIGDMRVINACQEINIK